MTDSALAWRRSNIGYLLNAASDRFLREKLAFVRARGFPAITEAQLGLLLHMDRDGNRPSTLAERVGLSKSSVSELLGRASHTGLISRRADPIDTRASTVILTPSGVAALTCVEQAIVECERELAVVVGERSSADLRAALSACVDLPNHSPVHEPVPMPDLPAWRQTNLGRLLALSSRQFVAEVIRLVGQAGHHEVGETLLTLFRQLDVDGSRLTELAGQARMTKQSMREIVARATALGFVEQSRDVEDARARQIRFTRAGLALLTVISEAVASAEGELSAVVGNDALWSMKAALRLYLKPDLERSGLPQASHLTTPV